MQDFTVNVWSVNRCFHMHCYIHKSLQFGMEMWE